MGGVAESARVDRAPPLAPANVPSLPARPLTDAAVGWILPQAQILDQTLQAGAAVPVPTQPQLQALALVLSQAPPQSVTGLPSQSNSKGLAGEAVEATKTTGRAAKKARAARQFQLARQLYAGPDEESPLISIVC